MSQRLAEAFRKNSQPTDLSLAGFREHIPPYLHNYEAVFSKESFDTLPEH
jgi:hypothetical protein